MTLRRRTRTRAEQKAIRRRAVARRQAELAAMAGPGGDVRRGVVDANQHDSAPSLLRLWQRATGYDSVSQRNVAEAEVARADAVARARRAGVHLP